MKKLLILIFVTQGSLLSAQKHTLASFVNVIHNINTYDEDIFNKDESISLPLQPLAEYGLQYNYRVKEKSYSFYAALASTGNGISIKRTFGTRTSGSSTSWSNANMRFGITEGVGRFQFSIGPSFKFVPDGRYGSSRSIGSSRTITNSSFHVLNGKWHSSVYLKTSYTLKKLSSNRSKLDLNIVANVGLQQIFTTASTVTESANRDVNQTLINNTGSFFGVGLTYSRISDDKFKDLLKFRSKKDIKGNKGKLDKATKVIGGIAGLFVLVFLAS